MITANMAWTRMLDDVSSLGREAAPRGMKIKEILGYQSKIDMKHPVVTMGERGLSRRFLTGEAIWIARGDNRVATISPYNKNISKFSDNGVYFAGAYGPKVVDQLSYVLDSLVRDRDSRQAVLTIWRENPRPSKDYPCTVAIQWIIREGKLHCLDTMRSSDAWLGWPYDVFNFSMLSAYVALLLRDAGVEVDLGTLVLTAGSQHIYETNFEGVEKCLNSKGDIKELAPLNLAEFSDPEDFLTHLEEVRDFRKPGVLRRGFLKELLG